MTTTRFNTLAVSAIALAGFSLLLSDKAFADADGGLETVVVTAEKRDTDLQQTPISIAVLGSEDLARRHIQALSDLGDGTIPSLRVAPFFARNSALTIGMRGIGALGDANQPARDQAVGVYLDGVYLGRAQGLGSAMYDVNHIEVLKGPQGTLFGRNTEGGAISIVTNAPSGKFDMRTTIGYGNFDAYNVVTHIDLPRFHDVSIKFDGLLSRRGGTVDNPTTSGQPDFNSYDKRGFAAEALWEASGTFTAAYAFDYSYDASTPYYVQLLRKGTLPLAPAVPLQPYRADAASVGVPLQPSVGITSGHRLNLNWDIAGGLTLKSISSYRTLTQTQYDNGEANLSPYAPNGTFSRYSLANVYQSQYSQELQLIGKTEQIDFVGGAFYYHEAVRDNAQTPNSMQWNATGTGYTTLSLDLSKVSFDRASHVATESYGVFGQAVWTPAFLDVAHLTLGGRFTRDAKVGSLDTVNGQLPNYVDAGKKTIVGTVPLHKGWSRFDPLVSLGVDVAPDVNVYAKWSTGYKAGGANSRSLTYRAFDPETVSMYELGAKTEFWDHRARLNLAAYTGTLSEAQVDFSVIILNNNRGTLETVNTAREHTQGIEADLTLEPIDGLTFTGSYAYSNVSITGATNPFTDLLTKVYPLFSPKNAASVAADYDCPLFGATFSAHVDANYSDGQYTSTSDPTRSEASFIVNGRLALNDIALDDKATTLGVALWSRNLFNEQNVFVRNLNPPIGVYGIYNDPRTFGIEAKFNY